MILDEPYEGISLAYKGDDTKLSELVTALDFVIKHAQIPSFTSTNVPGVDNATRITFVVFKGKPAFIVTYENGQSAIKVIEVKNVIEYVFTPCLLDLITLTPINKEDIL